MRLLVLFSLLAPSAVLASAGFDELTENDISTARKTYVAKCAKCHRFYDPNGYSEAAWRTWMKKMNQKSKLRPEQADLLDRYLDAYRAGRLPGKPQDKPKAPAQDGPR